MAEAAAFWGRSLSWFHLLREGASSMVGRTFTWGRAEMGQGERRPAAYSLASLESPHPHQCKTVVKTKLIRLGLGTNEESKDAVDATLSGSEAAYGHGVASPDCSRGHTEGPHQVHTPGPEDLREECRTRPPWGVYPKVKAQGPLDVLTSPSPG